MSAEDEDENRCPEDIENAWWDHLYGLVWRIMFAVIIAVCVLMSAASTDPLAQLKFEWHSIPKQENPS